MDQLTQEVKSEENFQNLLDEYEYERPKKGQLLKGEVRTIDDETIILDIGTKRAAIVPTREVKNLDDEIVENIAVGDLVPVYVTRTPVGDENLLVSIDDAKEFENWEYLSELQTKEDSLELEVVAYNKGGLLVQYEQLEGFVPNSLVPDLKGIYNHQIIQKRKNEMVGTQLAVKPIQVDRKNRKLVFSAAAVQKEKRKKRLQELEVGAVVEGTVANLVDFGAFIDLNGIDGLLHISEMSWENVEHPSDVVTLGDQIEVQVKHIDIDRERVSLTRKPLLPNPWETVALRYQPDDLVKVEIVNKVDFGAFAELPEGVQGLIHISELGYYNEDVDALEVGETVLVKVLSVDSERQRVSLSMKQVPIEKQLDWATSEDPTETQSEEISE
jgi:small subunit ribosomal protein S1